MNQFNLPPEFLLDFYKLYHRNQYPESTRTVVSNWTPRGSRINGVDRAVFVGLQAVLMDLFGKWEEGFFSVPWKTVEHRATRFMKYACGDQAPNLAHLKELHDLGHLPLKIKALPEGSRVKMRTACIQMWNTDKRFFWLTNYIESVLSCMLYGYINSATIADRFRRMFSAFALGTVGDTSFVPFQGHDFSFRGMFGLDAAVGSSMAHLLAGFVGTDTIPAIFGLEHYYGGNIEKELLGCSVPASEHSIQCAYPDDEAYFSAMAFDIHPTGIVSIVADGRDFWDFVGTILPKYKEAILARDGKVVIRPDSGDPTLILCGDMESNHPLARKGLIECLWDIFGGTVSTRGYRVLDPHIGAIYGDSITYDRAWDICQGLSEKNFASTNWVAGIGSFTYQYNTRDTLGQAIKATFAEIGDQAVLMQKTPKTDNGVKNSAKGMVLVTDPGGEFCMKDGYTMSAFKAAEAQDAMNTVWMNGLFHKKYTVKEIRDRICSR